MQSPVDAQEAFEQLSRSVCEMEVALNIVLSYFAGHMYGAGLADRTEMADHIESKAHHAGQALATAIRSPEGQRPNPYLLAIANAVRFEPGGHLRLAVTNNDSDAPPKREG